MTFHIVVYCVSSGHTLVRARMSTLLTCKLSQAKKLLLWSEKSGRLELLKSLFVVGLFNNWTHILNVKGQNKGRSWLSIGDMYWLLEHLFNSYRNDGLGGKYIGHHFCTFGSSLAVFWLQQFLRHQLTKSEAQEILKPQGQHNSKATSFQEYGSVSLCISLGTGFPWCSGAPFNRFLLWVSTGS